MSKSCEADKTVSVDAPNTSLWCTDRIYSSIGGPPALFDTIEWTTKEDNEVKKRKVLKPFEIKQKLDEYVIGQEEAKIILSVAAYNHYKRIDWKGGKDIEIQKSNILMIGDSGCGKTLLAETLSKVLDVPFVVVDATDFSPTGIVGKQTSEIIEELIQKADGDEQKATTGIVYIDEFDKLAYSTNENVNRRGVLSSSTQSCFLKLLEGKESSISSNNMFGSSCLKFNTQNVLFICGGAFSGIEKVLENESFNHQIGFGGEYGIKVQSSIMKKIEPKDIIKYGFMPEIVGRIPIIANLHPLKQDDLIRILTEPKNALIKQYQKLFELDGVSLDFTPGALNTIVNIAISTQTGARGLRTIIENVITDAIFEVTKSNTVRKCIVTSDSILQKEKPRFLGEDLSI